MTERRNDIRKSINQSEERIDQLRSAQNLTLERLIELNTIERQLSWFYAEVGYVRQDSSVSAPATIANLPMTQQNIISENERLWRSLSITEGSVAQLENLVARLLAGRSRYEAVQSRTGVPWFVVGYLHYAEGGLDFHRHLHNGDPLTARTVSVPVGRPIEGEPPFSWEDSATDAIKHARLDRDPASLTSIGRLLYLVERYNGLGYRRIGIYSPYIWGCTNHYTVGSFIADGRFEPRAVSRLCGFASVVRVLTDRGIVDFPQ